MQEAETLAELGRDQVAQRDVVDERHEPDRRGGLGPRGPHRHVVGDDRHLGFEIDAPGVVRKSDRLARPEE